MSTHLEVILEDLRHGLRHRADLRRKRARAAGATATSAAVVAAAVFLGAPFVTHPPSAAAGDGTLTARLLAGHDCPDGIACLPAPERAALNLPKAPKE